MRLSISNIAWDTADDERVAEILRRHQIDAIDVAPGKYFRRFKDTAEDEIVRVRDWWRERQIEIVGMQSLLFGTTGLNLFGDTETQELMLSHLTEVCRIGSALGARALVFGSPKNRDRTGLPDEAASHVAIQFFRRLADAADGYGVWICLEPNPSCYGSNFMLDSSETAEIVRAVDRPSVRMQLDAGSLTINGEDARKVIREFKDLVGHVHASEPELVTLGAGATDHANVADALREYLPEHVVTIEMLETKDGSNLVALERGLLIAIDAYRSAGPD